jgi:hypothetical protein
MCYWMRVDEILTFDAYWQADRFRRKRPDLRGTLRVAYGDNIYHRDTGSGVWCQSDSFHSHPDGVSQENNLRRDTFKTDQVLVAREFCYWGGSAPPRIPDHLRRFVHTTQFHKNDFSDAEKAAFMSWLATIPERGCIGEPANWPRD